MSSSDMSTCMLQRPALGRHFFMGTLYDAIREEIVPNITFWNESDLRKIKTHWKKKTEFLIVASTNLQDKCREMNFDDSLLVSMLCGMIELVDGSSRYLEKKKGTSRHSSVQVTFKFVAGVKSLTMEQLGNLRYPDIQKTGEIGSATHMVTEIEFGAECSLTFMKELSSKETLEEVEGQLKVGATELIEVIEAYVSACGDLKDTSLINVKGITCKFQGDLNLPDHVKAPTTYEEAIEFAKNLTAIAFSSMAKDPEDENLPLGVPITVSLRPLTLMLACRDAPQLLGEISKEELVKCTRITEEYTKIEEELQFLLRRSLVKSLRPLEKKLENFQENLKSYRSEMRKNWRDMVVDVRSGKITDDTFGQLLHRTIEDPCSFCPKRLQRWLELKQQELFKVKEFRDKLKSITNNRKNVLFFPSSSELRQHLTKETVNFGFEFLLSPLANKESFLEKFNMMHGIQSSPSDKDSIRDDNWCDDDSKLEQIRKELVVFATLSNDKSEDQKFAFAMTAHEEYEEEYQNTCTSNFLVIVHNKQKKIFGWDAVMTMFRYYPKDSLMNIVSLLAKEEISEEFNGFPLIALCRYYDKENLFDIVRLFVEKNIEINRTTAEGWNALLTVCRYYDKKNLIDIVRLFVEKNIEINRTTAEGWNALLTLCRNYKEKNLMDIVGFLVEKNIDVNCTNSRGNNALLIVCRHYAEENLIDIVRLLIEKNINVHCKTNHGRNALHFLCGNYKNENLIDIIRLLINNNIDVHCLDPNGGNALLTLCDNYKNENLIDIVRLLIEKNINVHCKTNHGRNSLHFLCGNYKNENLIDIIRLLINNNIDVHCLDPNGGNALLTLCDNYKNENLIDIVRLLIEKNINVHCKNKDGLNALHLVCRYFKNKNKIDIVRSLIETNIDVDYEDLDVKAAVEKLNS